MNQIEGYLNIQLQIGLLKAKISKIGRGVKVVKERNRSYEVPKDTFTNLQESVYQIDILKIRLMSACFKKSIIRDDLQTYSTYYEFQDLFVLERVVKFYINKLLDD